jgi:hypothetical protein
MGIVGEGARSKGRVSCAKNYVNQGLLYECISRTKPPFFSLRRASQTVIANFISPKMVANSARRRCCDGGGGPPDSCSELRGWPTVGGGGVGEGVVGCEPKCLRVEEHRRDGRRRVDENYIDCKLIRQERNQ